MTHDRTVDTATIAPARPRCEECQEIKLRRTHALQAGDLRRAELLTAAMGVHLRQAHA
ncbi:hypothetical protein AB0K09_11865 [Streptomyces sp. NPDC049577]|uniref:hypothetical protein n=1 Tax=Streptomyces sp. NPDC049577 TaxID=3155153 RepID=UPI003436141A